VVAVKPRNVQPYQAQLSGASYFVNMPWSSPSSCMAKSVQSLSRNVDVREATFFG